MRRSGRCGHGRLAAIIRCIERGAHARRARVFDLSARGCEVMLFGYGYFLGARSQRRSARTAVVAHVVGRAIDDDGLIVDVGDVDVRYVVDRAIVEKSSAVPIAAFITVTDIAEAVVDPAVEADVDAPI